MHAILQRQPELLAPVAAWIGESSKAASKELGRFAAYMMDEGDAINQRSHEEWIRGYVNNTSCFVVMTDWDLLWGTTGKSSNDQRT